MSTIRVAGIDIAKSVFQVCVWMVDASVAWNTTHFPCHFQRFYSQSAVR